jgi:hypothetical protein
MGKRDFCGKEFTGLYMSAMTTQNRSNLKKNIGLIHASGTSHFFDKRLYHILLKNAYDRLMEDDIHFIDLASLKAGLNFNSNNTKAIRESLTRLKSVSIEFDVLNQLKSYLYKRKAELQIGEWHSLTLLAEASIDNGIVSYEFSSTMRRLLYSPDMYALIDVNMSRHFTSGYAYSLYEIALRTGRIGSTGWISVEDFRVIMDVSKDVYARYRDFKRKVITVAQDEVNRLAAEGISSIQVSVLERRTGKKVTHVNIEVIRSDNIHVESELQVDYIYSETITDHQKQLRELLNTKYKLHIKQAALLVEKYEPCHIEETLKEVEAARKRPGFNNRKIAGFVYAAVNGRLSNSSKISDSGKGSNLKTETFLPNTVSDGTCEIDKICELYLSSLAPEQKIALVQEMIDSRRCEVSALVDLKAFGYEGEGRKQVIRQLRREPWNTLVREYSSQMSEKFGAVKYRRHDTTCSG